MARCLFDKLFRIKFRKLLLNPKGEVRRRRRSKRKRNICRRTVSRFMHFSKAIDEYQRAKRTKRKHHFEISHFSLVAVRWTTDISRIWYSISRNMPNVYVSFSSLMAHLNCFINFVNDRFRPTSVGQLVR